MRARAAILLTLAALAVGGAWLAQRQAAPAPRVGTGASERAAATPTADRVDPGLLAAPPVQAWRERETFKQDLETYLAHARQLDPAQRARGAVQLREQVRQHAERGELTAGESMLAQLALAQAATDDPAAQARAQVALMDRFRTDAARRQQQFLQQQQRDPAFRRYKVDERRIVAEVTAMAAVPGGMSRNEYLRERLQQAREQAYR